MSVWCCKYKMFLQKGNQFLTLKIKTNSLFLQELHNNYDKNKQSLELFPFDLQYNGKSSFSNKLHSANKTHLDIVANLPSSNSRARQFPSINLAYSADLVVDCVAIKTPLGPSSYATLFPKQHGNILMLSSEYASIIFIGSSVFAIMQVFLVTGSATLFQFFRYNISIIQ